LTKLNNMNRDNNILKSQRKHYIDKLKYYFEPVSESTDTEAREALSSGDLGES